MDDARAQELLAAERTRLEERLARREGDFVAEAPAGDSSDGDRAYDLTERERDSGRLEELRAELEALERAERRLAEGTYGLSVESGEPIPDGRLERLPAAELTTEEQSRRERSGG